MNRGQNDWLSSDTIVITELRRNDDRDKDYTLTAPGSGEMRLTFHTTDETAPPALLGLEWTESLTFNKDVLDGKLVDKAVFGSIENKKITGAILHSPRSSSQFAAKELELFLRDEEEDAAPDKEIMAEDMASSETFFKPMGDKKLERMVLTGGAEIRSIEHPVDKPQQRLRATLLRSNVLTYEIGRNKKDKKRQFYGDGPGNFYSEARNAQTTRRSGSATSGARPDSLRVEEVCQVLSG